jgi:hypothetical protein
MVGDIKQKGKKIIIKTFGAKNGSHKSLLSPIDKYVCKTPPPETNDNVEKRSSIVEQGKELFKKLSRLRKNTMDE